MNLAHLTQLQQLHSNVELSEGSVLPEQLLSLTLVCYFGDGVHVDTLPVVTCLQQLQRLVIRVGFQDHRLLLQLATLPALQHLALVYEETHEAVATASAWRLLPQLRELSLYLSDAGGVMVEQLEAIAAGAGAAASVTKLVLSAYMHQRGDCASPVAHYALADHDLPGDLAEADLEQQHYTYHGDGGRDIDVGVSACSSLARMTGLQELTVWGPRLVAGDALALTALTGLTRVDLKEVGDGVDDSVAAALARSLKQLCCLELQAACELGGEGSAAAVAELVHLTRLSLNGKGWLSGSEKLQRLI